MARTFTLTINGGAEQSPEDLGVSVAKITKRTQAPSIMVLSRKVDFDESSPPFAYNDDVVLLVDGSAFFRGRVRTRPRDATAESETQTIEVADAWDQMERSTYLETWLLNGGTVKLPKAILGLNESGSEITTGQQIADAVDYANEAGCDVVKGTVDAGFQLWPTEVNNVTIAEVIRLSMKFHPNWIAWVDHTTATPTLNARAQSSIGSLNFALGDNGGVSSFRVDPVDDRVPAGVRIIYETLNSVDGVNYRVVTIDQAGAATEGPGVLVHTIQLKGMKSTGQKQPIEVRTLPTDNATAKAWLKIKFPKLAEINDAHWDVVDFAKELVPDGPQPDPVNPQAVRLNVPDATDVPNELVNGSIQDWMRVTAGKVQITLDIIPKTGITADEQKKLSAGVKKMVVNATDALTKVYRGIASWEAAEDAPTGIAANILAGLSSTQYQGNISLAGEDFPTYQILGKKINLTNGRAEWATMGAIVHQVAYDVEKGQTSISFGPPPYLSPNDWLELQRAMRNRVPNWTSGASRNSDEKPDDGNDVVGPYDTPKNETLPGRACDPFRIDLYGYTQVPICPFGGGEALVKDENPTKVFYHFPDGAVIITEYDDPAPANWDAGWPDYEHIFIHDPA